MGEIFPAKDCVLVLGITSSSSKQTNSKSAIERHKNSPPAQGRAKRASPYIGPIRGRLYRTSNSIPRLCGMAIRRADSQDDRGGFMKKFLVVSALVLSSSCFASAESAPQRDPDNTASRNNDEPRRNFGWLGLLGLAGLIGLRRTKSEAAQRFESRGVKVNTV